jgi:excisionase family DNA binding protein
VTVTKNSRQRGQLNDLAAATVALAHQAGFGYLQHVLALHAAVRDGRLVARPTFWQLTQTRKARGRGEPCHPNARSWRSPPRLPAHLATAPRRPRRSSTSALAMLPEVLTAREAAAILRVGRNQLYQAVARGELGAVRIGRSIRIPKQAVLALLTAANPPVASGDE